MWLRLYTDILHDPKVQRLPDNRFKGWVNILCLAKENDGLLPSIEDIAFQLRISEAETESLVEELVSRGLLDLTQGGLLAPHNWDGRQFKTDVSTERVKRCREQKRNVSETPPETESRDRADTDTEQKEEASRAKPRSVRRPSQCDEQFLLELQTNPAYAGLDVQTLYHKMVVWCQNKGKQPTRMRLINWLNREERPMTAPTPQNGGTNGRYQGTRKETPNQRNARELDELIYQSLAPSGGTEPVDKPDSSGEGLTVAFRRL